MPVKSLSELMEDFENQVVSDDPTLTDWNDGSILDILNGVISTAVSEIQRLALDEFRKTFVETANGPEVTGGTDDLETLLVDHFGEEFRRPQATAAEGVVTFSRATDDAGNCTIPAGTIVKTALNASGVAQRFETESEVIMTLLTVNASVIAVEAGEDGNVEADEITLIESTLTDDTITVNNDDAMSGGTEEATDAEYREFARNLLVSVRGGTLASIEAIAKTVAGVEMAVGQENVQRVIGWDAASEVTEGDPFIVARVRLYIADANGTANQELIDAVDEAIEPVRACGVKILVLGASAIEVNLTVSFTFNISGPHYAEISADPQDILDDIAIFFQDLAIGDDFDRSDLEDYILGIWGSAGSDDLTAFDVSIPVGDVEADTDEKIILGEITVE